ncbi:MAG: hypothetical protein LBD97_10900 [Bifidobacteriaceae bacterium]|jgi:hypothetical protein|nr:hypothetical protein [Bifidobacteriaceae bacterium]
MTTRLRRAAAAASAGVLALGGALAATTAAHAASVQVSDVTLAWGVNDETNGAAFFGGCNFLSAGVAGDTGSARQWAEADGLYKATDGAVSIEKPTADGGWEAPTWSTKCQNSAGNTVTTAAGSTTGARVKFSGGTGEVDLDAGTAEITWDGGFTVAYYGGMTYWSAEDPVLTVLADGSATLTATGSGYATSMADMTIWEAITPTEIVLADFSEVELTAEGFTQAPEYLGVTVSGVSQTTTGDYWGSFPQSFVDFQQVTGQSSYWYSSGGSQDPKKVAVPVSVEWEIAPPLEPSVAVSALTLSADGSNTITITGEGFDPAAAIGQYPPLKDVSSGVYVAFGRFAEVWRPSEGAASSARPAAVVRWAVLEEHLATVGGTAGGGAVLNADGSFSITIDVSKALADAQAEAKGLAGGQYGIYTYPGGGASQPAFETYTPVVFVPGIPIEVEVPEGSEPPVTGEFSWRIAGSGAVSLGSAVEVTGGFAASGALPNIEVTDTRSTAPAWSLSGQVSDFTGTPGTFSGEHLGWTPVVASAGAGAVAGAAIDPDASGGLSTAKTLAFASAGHPSGVATIAAGLALKIPATTASGNYTGILTITAVG